MPDDAAGHKVVVLAGLSGGRKRGIPLAPPEVAGLTPDAENVPKIHGPAKPPPDDTPGLGFARVCAAVEERLVFTEMSESSAEADPRRKCCGGEQIQASTGSDEKSAVVDGDNVGTSVQVFVGIENYRHFARNGEDLCRNKPARVVDFKTQALARANKRIEIRPALDTLLAHLLATNHPCPSFLP